MKAIRTVLACLRTADQKFNLINHGDKIVVGLSGGKDSVALVYSLYLYQKFSHTEFTIQPVILDLGFDGFDPQPMIDFCKSLNLNLIVNDNKEIYPILKAHQEEGKHLPCSICSRMKKAAINAVAKGLGFNKVAFAHHMDDAIETLAMNAFYGGRAATFSPKMHLEKADIEFIRPLVTVREKDIIKLIKEENLPILHSVCPADKTTTRESIKQTLKNLYKKFPQAKDNLENLLTNYEHEDLWGKEIYMQINQDGLAIKPVVTKNDAFEYAKISDIPDKFEKTFLIYFKEKPIGTISYFQEDRTFQINKVNLITEDKKQENEIINYLSNLIEREFTPCIIKK